VIERNVRRELFKKLGVTRQAINQRAMRLKDKYGPMTTEEAIYIIAHVEGIDLSKYLPLVTLDRIRSLIPRDIKPQPAISSGPQKKAKIVKKRPKAISYPLVTASFIKQAVDIGGETFPQVVVLENSIRNLIGQTLSGIRKDWWKTSVPPIIQKNVQRTIDKEKKYPYRERRGNKPLMYCNFAELKEIIVTNHSSFHNVIVDLEWFKAKMDEVYMARNNLAHSVLLSKDDIARIALFYRDWARLLESTRSN
jgi:hypothetical protein